MPTDKSKLFIGVAAVVVAGIVAVVAVLTSAATEKHRIDAVRACSVDFDVVYCRESMR